MNRNYIYALLICILTHATHLSAGILYVNHYFIENLIEKNNIQIPDKAVALELKQKLNHNPNYIYEHPELLESYVRLYKKHAVGKRAIQFLLSTEDGRMQYKTEFLPLAPFIARIMQKKRRRSDVLHPLEGQQHTPDFSDEFISIFLEN